MAGHRVGDIQKLFSGVEGCRNAEAPGGPGVPSLTTAPKWCSPWPASRLGEDKSRDEIALQDLAPPALWPDVLGGDEAGAADARLRCGFDDEPVADFHLPRSSSIRRLDGVRVDPRLAEFGPTGEFMFAGLQPGLSAEQKKELNDVYLAAF